MVWWTSRGRLAAGMGLFMLAWGGAAAANDSTALLGAGGLELTQSPHIVMAREDLRLSPGAVQVTYEFRNESDADITTRVAFPLPLIEQGAASNVDLPNRESENIVDFRILVDGQPVTPELEQRAIMADGRDVTDILTAAGLPVNSFLPGWDDRLKALPQDVWMKLVGEGLFEVDAAEAASRPDYISPAWGLKASYHWPQTFPAGKTLKVEHSYRPIVGKSLLLEGDERIGGLIADYCLDPAGAAGLRRKLRARQLKARAEPDKPLEVMVSEVAYVLTTGANWKGPIGQFHLTIDKENPRAIVSLCMDGIRKTGDTTFEVQRENFTPEQDIRFVIFGE